MRFYNLDGIETDVQDPKLFINEEKYREKQDLIEEILDDYFPIILHA